MLGPDAAQVFGVYRASLAMPRAANLRRGSSRENVECTAYARSFVAVLAEFGTVLWEKIREGLRIFHWLAEAVCYVVNPANSGPTPCVELVFFRAQFEDEPILCNSMIVEVGLRLVPETKQDLWQFGRGSRWWDPSMESQQTLNCALSVDLLWNQRFRSDKRWIWKRPVTGRWLQVQAMKVRSQTFGSLTGTESFLTESLILAQNERWRRG
jgi:hypothetical protein